MPWPTMRELVSTPPPGVADTTMRIAFEGSGYAHAAPVAKLSRTAADAGMVACAGGAWVLTDIDEPWLLEGAQ